MCILSSRKREVLRCHCHMWTGQTCTIFKVCNPQNDLNKNNSSRNTHMWAFLVEASNYGSSQADIYLSGGFFSCPEESNGLVMAIQKKRTYSSGNPPSLNCLTGLKIKPIFSFFVHIPYILPSVCIGPPTIPSDTNATSMLQDEYEPGEVVEFRCINTTLKKYAMYY